MRDFFLILQYLTENKIDYCHQFQSKWDYHNLSLLNPRGDKMMLRTHDIETMEKQLKIIWGHVLSKTNSSIPTPSTMPLPLGM